MRSVSMVALYRAVALVAVLVCLSQVDGASSMLRRRFLEPVSSLMELDSAGGATPAFTMPTAMTATCQHGPYRVSNLSLAPGRKQRFTITSCTGSRVQTAIAGLTVFTTNNKQLKVATYLNGKDTKIFSANKVACFQKPTGLVSAPSDHSGEVALDVTCLDKKTACKVTLAWATSCGTIAEDDDDSE